MASPSSSLDGPQKKKKRSNEREKFPDFSGAVRQMGDGEVSMSVEETNKMRLALGLKPLKVDAVQEKSRQEERLRRGRRDDERKEEENENGRAQKVTKTEKHDADALRDRLAAAREERLAREKLVSAPRLGAADTDVGDDMRAWVEKSRQMEKKKSLDKARDEQKRRAEKMAKLLSEQDDIAQDYDNEDDTTKSRNSKGRAQDDTAAAAAAAAATYSSRDLAGLAVKHSLDTFEAGESVILTLQDQSILAEDGKGLNDDEDMLHNALITEDTTRKDARKEAKKEAMGRFANDMDIDGEGDGHDAGADGASVLAKYDSKEQTAKLQIGASGTVLKSEEERKAEISRRLKHGLKGTLTSLETEKQKSRSDGVGDGALPSSSDFYTQEELDAMRSDKDKKKDKKKNKKKKMRKRASAFDIEELEREAELREMDDSLGGNADGAADHGSRAKRSAETMSAAQKASTAAAVASKKFDRALEKAREKSKGLAEPTPQQYATHDASADSTRDAANGNIENNNANDDDDDELQASLARARRVARVARQSAGVPKGAEALAKMVRESASEQKVEFGGSGSKGGSMVLTDAQEFVKSIDISKVGDDITTQSVGDKIDVEMEEATGVADNGNVDTTMPPPPPLSTSDAAGANGTHVATVGGGLDDTRHNESHRRGIAGMLGMLRHKGELDEDNFAGRTNDKKTWARVGKDTSADDEEEARRRRNNDKNNRIFDVNINRYDEFGRVLTPKEAFRQDCWQFHGIMPSKNTKEKRIKKYQEDQKLKKMGQEDTPLHVMEKMKMAQDIANTPYLVLSGDVKPGQTR